jgi:hypothetical protein
MFNIFSPWKSCLLKYKVLNYSRTSRAYTGVQLKSETYFNMSNLFTKIYNVLYYTTNLYLQQVLKMMSINFNALTDTFNHVPRNFS